MTTATDPEKGPLAELVVYFLRLGVLGFGGPGLIFGIELREFFFANVFNVLFHVFWIRAGVVQSQINL